MKKVLLYFPDAVNMQAFMILEKIAGKNIDQSNTLLETMVNDQQLTIACMKYGAILQTDEEQASPNN